jgi:hypothetical protein
VEFVRSAVDGLYPSTHAVIISLTDEASDRRNRWWLAQSPLGFDRGCGKGENAAGTVLGSLPPKDRTRAAARGLLVLYCAQKGSVVRAIVAGDKSSSQQEVGLT